MLVDIRQVSYTYRGIFVVFEHRVDGFGKLGATAFVDTACIDPSILATIRRASHVSKTENLLVALKMRVVRLSRPVVVADFFVFPGVGKYGIIRCLVVIQLLQLQIFQID